MNTTKKATLRNSTVAISQGDVKRLDDFCKKIGVKKKDFISLSLDYFISNGINPATDETPVTEIGKITKRLNQFFAFFKQQEKEILHPMLSDLLKESQEIKDGMTALKNNQDTLNRKYKITLENYDEKINKDIENFSSKTEVKYLTLTLAELIEKIDPQNKTGVIDKLFRK